MLGRFGPYKNAVWIMWREGEAALLEMPPHSPGQKKPWLAAASFLKKRKLKAKYAFLSHAHIDHCHSLLDFRTHFPRTRFVAHRSVAESRVIQGMEWMARNTLPPGLFGRPSLFHELFRSNLWKGELGGEPIYLIHAPKHSHSDQLVLFRGAMMTGDWFLGDLKDCNALVEPKVKKKSIDWVVRIVDKLGYHVHMMFSGHGDCLFYDVDFQEMMRKSKIDHDRQSA